jgi:hypothetical protein
MSKKRSRHYTQWAGQFYVAAELSRRGYIVSFTFGNAPMTDLHATSPSKESFRIECKTLSSIRSSWMVGNPDTLPAAKDLFFVLVYVPLDDHEAQRYYILPSGRMKAIIGTIKRNDIERGVPSAETYKSYGPKISEIKKYENAWDLFPE